MNTLIIGGAGYIGSVLSEFLLSKGYSVGVLDSLRYKQKSILHLCNYENFSFHLTDCRDSESLKNILPNYDVIIHLAAIVGAEACDLMKYDAESINVGATKNICNLLSKDQILLFPCTNSGYGVGQNNIFCTEKSPLKPISIYGKTKVSAEEIVMSRKNSISFRLATVFGSSLSMRTELLVNNFVLRAFRDKAITLFESHFKRNYIHVKDVCRAFEMGIDKFDTMKDNIYNVGLSSANLSKLELCNIIKKYIDFTIIECNDRKDIDQRNYIVSNEKIEKHGFNPLLSIDDGVIELIKSYSICQSSYYDV